MAKKHAKNAQLLILDALAEVPAASRWLPTTIKPLFLAKLVHAAALGQHIVGNPEVLARREAAREVYASWAKKLGASTLHKLTESEVEADFTGHLLRALGYLSHADVAADAPYFLSPKWHVPGQGTADVALGAFGFDAEGNRRGSPKVVVELKGAGTDLDKRASKGRSPVGQAWDYLTATDGAEWAIVSNFEEIRLYSRRKGSNALHRVFLADLARDADAFDDFFAVFHAESLLGTGTFQPKAAHILEETEQKQEEVGYRLYAEYDERRKELVAEFQSLGHDRLASISAAQTLLDRVLFIAFAEDRGLLHSPSALDDTFKLDIPMHSKWKGFQFLFRAMDLGDPRRGMPRYNGELFKPHPILDSPDLDLDDKWPTVFRGIGQFDFKDEVTVEVLGQIFELSISKIEHLKANGDAPDAEPPAKPDRKNPGRRKLQGVFYTDASIVEYLVGAALDPSYEAERARQHAEFGQDPEGDSPPPADLSRALIAWVDGLAVCDPACGSGAFLIGAYNWLEDHRLALLADLKDAAPDDPLCEGDVFDWRARSATSILANNLFGVDLSFESVEIARLSLWIRTARKGQVLANLAANVVRGNSVVADPAADPLAFDWDAQFARVRDRGGFDAVVGNPPYIRQERLAPFKPHFEANYAAYHGMADLYVYFYERGLGLLKPGGRLAFVVTNKWMKSGYGEPLRALFGRSAWVESVVDFGHAKQFFKNADVFPCFLVLRKPDDAPPPATAAVATIPRDPDHPDLLKAQVGGNAIPVEVSVPPKQVDLKSLISLIGDYTIPVERDRFASEAWQLEPQGVRDLMDKIRRNGVPLAEYAGVKPYYGIKTGFNEAFLIDTATKERLVRDDPKSAEILKPYLRGQDIKRWAPEWAGLWMIFARRGFDLSRYPAIEKHLQAFRPQLEPKPSGWADSQGEWPGRKEGNYQWFELQDTVDYHELFSQSKIMYQEIQFHPNYSLDASGRLGNNKVFFIAPSVNSIYALISILNSALMWWHNWRYLPHMKDEALSPSGYLMENLPISIPSQSAHPEFAMVSSRLISNEHSLQIARSELIDWVKTEYDVARPTTRLQDPAALSSDEFVEEVKKARGKSKGLTIAALKRLREEYAGTIEPARLLAAESLGLERQLHDLVNAAYGLTAEEVRLMWDTAPPRMPIKRPAEV